MSSKYETIYAKKKKLIEEELQIVFSEELQHSPQKVGVQAMRYSLEAGGKRLRPVLLLQVSEMYGVCQEEAMPFALALEFIHTYSLIHDDLPVMDNDDLRRGKPTNHRVYGEANAILAGDALLNLAYEYILEQGLQKFSVGKLKAAQLIAASAGIQGMIAGQVLDLEMEKKTCKYEILRYIHANKTGALLKAATLAGAYIGNAPEEEIEALKHYADCMGLVFQITDDILDVTGNANLMGKNTGMDLYKNTYPALLGMEQSKQVVKNTVQEALVSLERVKKDCYFLEELLKNMVYREW